MEFIRGTTLVHFKMRCWSGEKKASRDRDIQLGSDGKLPPQKLLDLGRKKIFPPQALSPLENKRGAAQKACLRVGTRFMGGYAVPDEDVDELMQTLSNIKASFHEELSQFLTEFNANKAAWLADNQEFAHILRDQVPDRFKVEKAFEFSIKAYKLATVEGFELDENEVADQLLSEIGAECKQMSNRMLRWKCAVKGQKLIQQLEPLIKKMITLSFGNGRVLAVLNEFYQLKQSIPLEPIDHDHPTFGQVLTFLSMCADSQKLEHIISGEFSINHLIQVLQNAQPDPDSKGADEWVQNGLPLVGEASSSTSGAYF